MCKLCSSESIIRFIFAQPSSNESKKKPSCSGKENSARPDSLVSTFRQQLYNSALEQRAVLICSLKIRYRAFICVQKHYDDILNK